MEIPTGEVRAPESARRPPGPRWRAVHRLEDVLLATALTGIVAIPLSDVVLRAVFRSGLPGANTLTQYLTLLIGMFGGAVAAREIRLLALSEGFSGARAPWGALFETLRAGMSVGVSLLLAWAATSFLLSQYTAVDAAGSVPEQLGFLWQFLRGEHQQSPTIAPGIPVWVPLLVMVGGFAIVGARQLIHVRIGGWRVRLAVAVLAAVIVYSVLRAPVQGWTWPIVLLALLLAAVVCGAPIFVLLGGAAVFLFWQSGTPLATIALSHQELSTNPTIPALPLFTLAGYFLAEGGTSRRMFRLLRALVGGFNAGPALVTVLACAFFTSLTGASGVTILALGGLLVPFLRESRYSERESVGFFTCAGSVGMLFAPCLPLILYAIVAHVEIKAMFLGGIGPGIVFVIATTSWAAWRRPRASASAAPWKFDGRETWSAVWDAKWELLIPVVILGGIFSGLATPVEASAITALYAFFTQTILYRDLKPGALLGVFRECGMLMGGVLLMLGVAQAFTNYLTDAQIPALLVTAATSHIGSKFLFLALLNVVLILVGCVMEVFQAIIVVAPLVAPLGAAFGIDPVHLGILFLANLELGFMMPPVGMNLVLAAFRFKKSMGEVLRAVAPYLWPQFAVVLLISYWSALSEFLPRWFGF